jgi:hypothetical protein
MDRQYHQLNRHTINSSFYSEHPKIHGPVRVFSALHYLMAEYSIPTGVVRWLRNATSTERGNVEKWLDTNYPVPTVR